MAKNRAMLVMVGSYDSKTDGWSRLCYVLWIAVISLHDTPPEHQHSELHSSSFHLLRPTKAEN